MNHHTLLCRIKILYLSDTIIIMSYVFQAAFQVV